MKLRKIAAFMDDPKVIDGKMARLDELAKKYSTDKELQDLKTELNDYLKTGTCTLSLSGRSISAKTSSSCNAKSLSTKIKRIFSEKYKLQIFGILNNIDHRFLDLISNKAKDYYIWKKSLGLTPADRETLSKIESLEYGSSSVVLHNGKLALQEHHFIPWDNDSFTDLFIDITKKYGLDTPEKLRKSTINLGYVYPHSGRHSEEYSKFIDRSLREIHSKANGNKEIFFRELENLKLTIAKEAETKLYN